MTGLVHVSFLALIFLSPSIIAVALPNGAHVKRHTSQLLPNYDYIIAGGGTSGLTVADRLTSAFPHRSVLVVEHGDLINSSVLLMPATTVPNRDYSFDITSLPEPGLNNRSFAVTVGKVVGGCSAINAQMFDRGSAADYDAWGDVTGYAGEGWNWQGLLPYFKKSVTFTNPSSSVAERYGYSWDAQTAYGGKGGIQASYPPFQWPSEKLVRTAWTELGVPQQKEGAGGDAYGVFWFPSSQDPKTQTRSYARTGHFDGVANRSNYHLLVGHKVTEVILGESKDGDRQYEARGVKIQATIGKNASTIEVTSDQEVVLAAGAIHTPGVLQRSGIGPKNVLEAAGITTKVELPGVGQNFQDHALGNLFWNMTTDVQPSPMTMFMNRTLLEAARREYAENKTGPLTLSGGNSGAFLPLSSLTNNSASIISALATQSPSTYLLSSTHPTVLEGYAHQLDALKNLFSSKEAAVFEYPIGTNAMLAFLKPLSRGTVNINPKNPLAEPLVNYRTFTNPLDLALTIHGARIFRRLFQTASAKILGPIELFPGAAVQTDEDWSTWLKSSIFPSFYHPVGTASLGPKTRGGVVGPDLMVHGVARLRVVDASIMPLIPGTHTSSTVYAVAEKAADLIVEAGMKA